MKTQYLEKLPEHWLPSAMVFSALGDATRQKILLLFEPGEELSITDIAGRFSLGRSTVVHHLAVLEKCGALRVRRQGKLALYRVEHGPILEALENLRLLIAEDLQALGKEGGQGWTGGAKNGAS
ncbi:metalloregulator ArsR/SmtB family transcription factor [Desulfovibrio sp. OttesenSCG-928-C14]|nr:metalloregulator ArsR/SmtB family transcription factor [Desulfovibrio sp. OttesenSCG-928-C14]